MVRMGIVLSVLPLQVGLGTKADLRRRLVRQGALVLSAILSA
jgi:hypothetical protein